MTSKLGHTIRIYIVILEKRYVLIQHFCKKYGWFDVDKRNIQGEHLYKDGVHVMEEDKIILARNLIFCFNNNTSNYFLDFRQAHTHHPLVQI